MVLVANFVLPCVNSSKVCHTNNDREKMEKISTFCEWSVQNDRFKFIYCYFFVAVERIQFAYKNHANCFKHNPKARVFWLSDIFMTWISMRFFESNGRMRSHPHNFNAYNKSKQVTSVRCAPKWSVCQSIRIQSFLFFQFPIFHLQTANACIGYFQFVV